MPPAAESVNLARELSGIAFGSVLFAAGLAALLLPAIYRPARNLSLTAFGAAVLLYGVRVIVTLPAFRSTMPVPPGTWDHIEAVCTYLLPVTVFVFTDHYWGAGAYSSLRRVWQIHLAYAVLAIALDAATGTPNLARFLNGPLVIVWMTVVLFNVVTGQILIRRDDRVVRIALVALVLSIVNDNLVGLRLVPWALMLEPIGIVAFVGCLGYALALRTFENERRLATLDYELRTARRIQQSLLPRDIPQIPEDTIAVRYIPMAAVGGDLYDYLPVDERRFGVLVADVTGHGIPAALIASMVKTAAATQVRLADRPADVLSGINRHLCGQVDGHYVTAVYAYLDLDAGRVSLANAGHPPPFLFSSTDGAVSEVGDSGLMLGFLPDADYPTTDLALASGDRLLLYTDGVVEAISPGGEFFERERLRRALGDHASLSGEEFADRVLTLLTEWTGTVELELDDDLTLVVVDVSDGV